jgi:hypothetical protein
MLEKDEMLADEMEASNVEKLLAYNVEIFAIDSNDNYNKY